MSDVSKSLDALAPTSRKRVRVHDAMLPIKMPSAVRSLISEVAEREGISDAAVVRWALSEFFNRRGYNR